MYIFSVEEAQKDLQKLLELVADGKDVAIGGERPVLLLKVRSVRNFDNDHPDATGSIIVFDPEDESAFEDESFKPLPDDIIEQMVNGPIFPEEINVIQESR
ncbi:hypothetical protein BTHE68_38530 [Burkholderia sp. THE68]|uniref:hypothetical protein n=1 Tax=Burkholderiaceae TaxID=119060 RepID=UPI0013186F9D|nr:MULTISPECIES: hypothetical protein [Burkholderiaceae]BBU30119.1 hypothetical protein BTHE68_38530 [Burkholderia sp. THE68]BCQ25959.1 hypothetical protein NK8_41430 [Caballeronia sp. NK8]